MPWPFMAARLGWVGEVDIVGGDCVGWEKWDGDEGAFIWRWDGGGGGLGAGLVWKAMLCERLIGAYALGDVAFML